MELHQCPLFGISSGLLALKTKHNDHSEVCLSQDSWLQATATNPIFEARLEFAVRLMGACRVYRQLWDEAWGMGGKVCVCVGRGSVGGNLEPAS